jgi:NAD(P)H-flavin reductase
MNYDLNYIFKTRYYIEPSGPFGWVFRREGSDKIIKRAKHKSFLMVFASDFIQSHDDEVYVCDENGMLVEVKKFKTE